jgi:hypothetical protein
MAGQIASDGVIVEYEACGCCGDLARRDHGEGRGACPVGVDQLVELADQPLIERLATALLREV